jgi:prepilin-type N-terminal cleavage/methylation domain-containing protein
MLFLSNSSARSRHGFGLIELMVSISIMAMVSAIIMTRQSAFNGAVLLRNQAYEVAFALREAQLLAVSGGDENNRQYGVYFDPVTASQRTYRIFRDTNENATFDSGEQIGLTGQLDSRFEIRGVSPTPTTGTGLAVIFTRPNFDARFCGRTNGCTTPATFAPASQGHIDVARLDVTTNGTGDVRRVQISSTGQISVVTY